MREALAIGVKSKPKWAKNGLTYIKDIMAANDGSAEATILIALAEKKKHTIHV
jgi:UDP-glucose:(heptosyl)LPS alpha-1,3-glucosyltransferase